MTINLRPMFKNSDYGQKITVGLRLSNRTKEHNQIKILCERYIKGKGLEKCWGKLKDFYRQTNISNLYLCDIRYGVVFNDSNTEIFWNTDIYKDMYEHISKYTNHNIHSIKYIVMQGTRRGATTYNELYKPDKIYNNTAIAIKNNRFIATSLPHLVKSWKKSGEWHKIVRRVKTTDYKPTEKLSRFLAQFLDDYPYDIGNSRFDTLQNARKYYTQVFLPKFSKGLAITQLNYGTHSEQDIMTQSYCHLYHGTENFRRNGIRNKPYDDEEGNPFERPF